MAEKKTKVKTNAVEYERRLLAIQGWIVERHGYMAMVTQILAARWAESDRHAKRMISTARDRWVVDESQSIDQRRQIKIRQLEHTARTLKDVYKGTPEGIRAIVAVEKEIIKLEGLAAPIKMEHTGKDGDPIRVEQKTNVDYTKLSTEVLKQIVSARVKAIV